MIASEVSLDRVAIVDTGDPVVGLFIGIVKGGPGILSLRITNPVFNGQVPR